MHMTSMNNIAAKHWPLITLLHTKMIYAWYACLLQQARTTLLKYELNSLPSTAITTAAAAAAAATTCHCCLMIALLTAAIGVFTAAAVYICHIVSVLRYYDLYAV
jgi:hypothetical protein